MFGYGVVCASICVYAYYKTRYMVILFGSFGVSIHHIDLWRKNATDDT